MRRVSMATLVGLLVGVQGCNLQIPSGLINTAGQGPVVSGAEDCRALFFKLDLNGDKSLTVEEYVQGRAGKPAPKTQKQPTREERKELLSVEDDLRAGFKAMDADGDGTVSQDEFLNSCQGDRDDQTEDPIGEIEPIVHPEPGIQPPVMEGRPWPLGVDCVTAFKNADQNHDGRWDREEHARFASQWPLALHDCPPSDLERMPRLVPDVTPVVVDGKIIASGGGAASPPAIAPCPESFPAFEQLDSNRDGGIDPDELCAAFGDPGVMPPPPPPMPPTDECGATFKRADANGDGAVSPEEYMRADYRPPLPEGLSAPAVMPSDEELKRRFLSLDHNQDGKLSPEEFCSNWGGVILPPPSDDCRVRFKPLDSNLDGRVDWVEFFNHVTSTIGAVPSDADYARFKDEQYTRFKRLDLNADQNLSPEEFCVDGSVVPVEPAAGDCEGSYKVFDKDGSGWVSYDEYAGGRYGELRFVQAPTQEEAAKLIYDFKARAKALDGNADQKLSYEEFKQSCLQ